MLPIEAFLPSALGAQSGGVPGPGGTPAGGCVGAAGRVASLCSAPASIHLPVDYLSFLPILVVGGGALLLLLVSSLLPKRSRPGLYSLLTVVVGGVSAIVTIPEWLDVARQGRGGLGS